MNRHDNKKNMLSMWLKKTFASLAMMLLCLTCSAMTTLPGEELSDGELSDVTGQALFQLDKQTIGGYTYYRMALDVNLSMNLNIASLQLGKTSTGVDISGTNVSFGCVADAGGTCITAGSATTKSQLKNFDLTRPYVQFAIKNDNNASQREVVGVRLGAEQVSGPLSFGTLNSFSGYLSGTTTITMYGTCNDQQGNRFCSQGIPSTPACNLSGYPSCGSGSQWIGEPETPYPGNLPYTSMGLTDDSATVLGIGAWLHELAIGFPDASVKDTSGNTAIPTEATGSRIGYAYVAHVNFQSAISTLVSNIECKRTSNGLGCGAVNFLLPVIAGQVTTKIGDQIKNGMNPASPGSVNLSDLTIPYNLKNIHQLDINSGNFGLSFQKEAITYPGYVNAAGAAVTMNPGWSMYANNAFNLVIAQPTWNFTNGIVSGAARNGNIVALPGPYNNCWGSSNFC